MRELERDSISLAKAHSQNNNTNPLLVKMVSVRRVLKLLIVRKLWLCLPSCLGLNLA